MVIAGADRVARNGDTANKVGTRMLAVLAHYARKPFYIAAPSSSFDVCTPTGRDIPIEERDGREVRRLDRCRVASDSTPVFNPAFDITPGRLITAFITEHGIIRAPFGPGIKRSLRPKSRDRTATKARKTRSGHGQRHRRAHGDAGTKSLRGCPASSVPCDVGLRADGTRPAFAALTQDRRGL
jgi:hypothetical protein